VQTARVKDLMDFAASLLTIVGTTNATTSFRLVTRFPRRVFDATTTTTNTNTSSATLAEADISAGQELFMVEMI
jgi:hypothetical protein